MILRILKFIGPYKALKGDGFQFQRLYARNYMQWCKTVGPEPNNIRIWKKGNDVEFDDLFHHSGNVAEYVRDTEPEELRCFSNKTRLVWRIVVNRKTCKTEQYVHARHYHSYYMFRDSTDITDIFKCLKPEIKNAMIPDISYKEHCKTYKTVLVVGEFGMEIRKMFKRGWFTVVEEQSHK